MCESESVEQTTARLKAEEVAKEDKAKEDKKKAILTAPEATDDVLEEARKAEGRRTKARRGRRSTFLTGMDEQRGVGGLRPREFESASSEWLYDNDPMNWKA